MGQLGTTQQNVCSSLQMYIKSNWLSHNGQKEYLFILILKKGLLMKG